MLFEQSQDSHEGVVVYLSHALQAQEWKESIIAYGTLLALGGEAKRSKVDEESEKFIRTACGESVDFEVRDSMKKLKRLGMVRVDKQKEVKAVSVEEAIRKLSRRLEEDE